MTELRKINIITIGAVLLIITVTSGLYLGTNFLNTIQQGSIDIIGSYSMGNGDYARMTDFGDHLLVSYNSGSILLTGFNLTTNETDFSVPIVTDAGRVMLAKNHKRGQLVCTFNHGGTEMGASIGIAFTNMTSYNDTNDWRIQRNLLGPVAQPNHLVGIWEPYLYPMDSVYGDFLLLFSNQTDQDEDHMIDDNAYVFHENELQVNQQIAVYWVVWNGTGYEINPAGILSENINGADIFEKDGMVSIVNISETEYIASFETFPFGQPATIKAVKFQIGDGGTIESLERIILAKDGATAPYLASVGDYIIVSYHTYDRGQMQGFAAIKKDLSVISNFIHCPDLPPWWASIHSDAEGRLWHIGRGDGSGELILSQLQYTPYFYAPPFTFPFIIVAIASAVVILGIRIKYSIKKHE